MLNTIGKHIRNCHSKPFGGIQVIFSGDFYQLPPVGNKEDPDSMRFCFESEEWSQVFPVANQIQLITIFRQSDPVYSSILNQIREGKMKRSSVNILEQYVGRKIESGTIIQPTKIYPTKYLVETMNQQNMTRLETEEKEYQAKQLFQLDCEDNKKRFFTETDIQHELDFLASNLLCDRVLKLKIGAQVMCIVNMKMNDELLLCNGSQGIVTKFCPTTGMPIVKYQNGLEISMNRHTWVSEKIPGIGISQIPLILAWALTIHKSQGSTLDAAEINVGSDIFECGQTYVALSRVKSLDGLYLTSFNYSKIKINKKVKEFYESFSKG
jgi:ATP-dependent DNA helicase PIF1